MDNTRSWRTVVVDSEWVDGPGGREEVCRASGIVFQRDFGAQSGSLTCCGFGDIFSRLLVITVSFLVASFGLMTWMFWSFQAAPADGQVAPAAIAQRSGDRLPPLPRLQTTPYADLKSFQASERHVLDSYAWVDQANGVVRMPIADAIKHVAATGLPKPIAAPAPAAADAAAATAPVTR